MLRRPRMVCGLLMCLFICPLGIGCGSGSDATSPSTSDSAEDVEVPTVELPEEPVDESQGPADE